MLDDDKKWHFAFWLDEDLYCKLKVESEKNNVTSTILLAKNRPTHDTFFDEPRPMVSKARPETILERLDEKNAELDGENTTNHEMGECPVYFHHKKNDEICLLNFLELHVSAQIEFRKKNCNGMISHAIRCHHIRRTRSLFLKEVQSGVMEKISNIKVSLVKIRPNLSRLNLEAA